MMIDPLPARSVVGMILYQLTQTGMTPYQLIPYLTPINPFTILLILVYLPCPITLPSVASSSTPSPCSHSLSPLVAGVHALPLGTRASCGQAEHTCSNRQCGAEHLRQG